MFEKPEKKKKTYIESAKPHVSGGDVVEFINDPLREPDKKPSQPEFRETSPSPKEIATYLHHLTPYEKHNQITRYDGLEVSWRLLFTNLSLYNKPAPEGDAMLYLGDRKYVVTVTILCRTNILKYPRFKIIHSNTEIGVTGKIAKVGTDFLVHLEDYPQFTFFDVES